MIFAVMAQIEVSLPAKADALVSDVLAEIANKPLWAGQKNKVVKGLSEKGNPQVYIEQRFNNKADQIAFTTYLNKQRALLPFLSGSITIHDCYHDEGGRSCDNWKDI